MSRNQKLIAKLRNKSKAFTYDELCKVLAYLGYVEDTKGKTSGSRVAFTHTTLDSV